MSFKVKKMTNHSLMQPLTNPTVEFYNFPKELKHAIETSHHGPFTVYAIDNGDDSDGSDD